MSITFNAPHPLFIPALPNPIPHIPDDPGVYIVGVKIDDVFCSLYNGIATNLNYRINQHRNYDGGYLNSVKELFDLQLPMDDVYYDINIWELSWRRCNNVANQLRFFNDIRRYGKDSLLWFNSPSFFRNRLSALLPGILGVNHTNAITYLTSPTATPAEARLAARIIATKKIILDNFYYCYCAQSTITDFEHLPGANDKAKLEFLEAKTKYCLYDYFKTPTYAHMTGAGKPIYQQLLSGNVLPNIAFDFTAVPNIRNPFAKPLGGIVI